MSCLIVFNLPCTITKTDLMETFSQKGHIRNIQLMFNIENDYCYFALIKFETEEEANTALKHYNNTYQYSSRISIEKCKERVDNEIVKDIIEYPEDTLQTKQNNKVIKCEENNEPTMEKNVQHEEVKKNSPANQTGKLVYSKSSMLLFENEPICLKIHDSLKSNEKNNYTKPTNCTKPTNYTKPSNLKNDKYNIKSILNQITPKNITTMTKQLKTLTIDTEETLKKIIDLIFEKAIKDESCIPLCASLCSAIPFKQVGSQKYENKRMIKMLIISKCQSFFEVEKTQKVVTAKELLEINSCKDLKNKKKLHKRSAGICRFIVELFKQNIVTDNIMLYRIVDMVNNHVGNPLECLCILLKSV